MSNLPPPGWYPDGGPLRWWDGHAWGPWAPPTAGTGLPPHTEEERGRTMAVVSHLGFVASFILPLVIYLVERGKPDRNRFVCHHACEALNWTITFTIVWVGSIFLMFGTMFATMPTQSENAGPPLGFFIFPLFFVMMGLNYGFSIMAMVRANQGVWWRYPICLRLVGRGIDWQHAPA